MPSLSRAFATVLIVVTLASPAFAHYLWVVIDKKGGKQGIANVYFEGSAAPGDGHYLDHFTETGKTWIRTVEHPKPQLLKTQDTRKAKKRWLATELPAPGPRSIDSYAKFGVYAYGKTNVLLHYYARNLDLNTHEDLHELARAEQMDMDIVPHDHAGKMELRVLWKGKPASGRLVHIRGPKGFSSNLKSNKNGLVSFEAKAHGGYTFRTFVEESVSGKDGGESYTLIRHHATMSMILPLEK